MLWAVATLRWNNRALHYELHTRLPLSSRHNDVVRPFSTHPSNALCHSGAREHQLPSQSFFVPVPIPPGSSGTSRLLLSLVSKSQILDIGMLVNKVKFFFDVTPLLARPRSQIRASRLNPAFLRDSIPSNRPRVRTARISYPRRRWGSYVTCVLRFKFVLASPLLFQYISTQKFKTHLANWVFGHGGNIAGLPF
jgi:hypothetical protein